MIPEDYLLALDIASLNGAIETRPTGTTDRCSVCELDVALVEDRCPRLTSSGTGYWWVPRKPETHSFACFQAFRARPRPTVDLWGTP